MNWIKSGLVIILLSIFLFGSFYFYAKSSWNDPDAYHQVRQYDYPLGKTADTLTVMTYNIGYLSGMTNNLPVKRERTLFDDNLDKSRRLIRYHYPDIIGFQEIDFNSSRSFNVHQLDSIALYVGYPNALQSVNWDKRYVPFPYWPTQHHFGRMLSGQALLSRFEITEFTVVTLDKPFHAPFYYKAIYLERLVQIMTIQINETPVTVMNLHLEAFDQETRLIQANEVKRLFEVHAAEGPVLLIGDFNGQPEWEQENYLTMQVIMSAQGIASAVKQEAYEQNPALFYTYSSHNPTRMIDFILYSKKDFDLLDANVMREVGEVSDHLPLIATFKIL